MSATAEFSIGQTVKVTQADGAATVGTIKSIVAETDWKDPSIIKGYSYNIEGLRGMRSAAEIEAVTA